MDVTSLKFLSLVGTRRRSRPLGRLVGADVRACCPKPRNESLTNDNPLSRTGTREVWALRPPSPPLFPSAHFTHSTDLTHLPSLRQQLIGWPFLPSPLSALIPVLVHSLGTIPGQCPTR